MLLPTISALEPRGLEIANRDVARVLNIMGTQFG